MSTKENIEYTSSVFHCNHCGNSSPMIIQSSCINKTEKKDESTGQTWEYGDLYSILACPVCKKVTVTVSSWHEGMEDENELSYKVLFPPEGNITRNLPKESQKQIEFGSKMNKESFMPKNNKIELSTRRNILDAFLITKLRWYGNLEQPNFLGRLFDLSQLPSTDQRYKTAAQDITKHTVLNDDWPDEWVFTDSRFNILYIDDDAFLNFLCQTIHPAVRDNQEQVTTLLEIYNNNISKHRFEIVKSGDIAGKPVYSFREIGYSAPVTSIPSPKVKRLALVVGCSDYKYAIPLNNPKNDANGITLILQNLDFEVDTVIDPSQKDLKIAIDEFGEKLKAFQVGLYFFAGHGVQVKGLNYIIPVDANLKSEKMVEYDCVEANRVLGLMEDSRCPVNIMILDACRDNPFERSWSRGTGQRGLAPINAPIGSLIAYSTAPGTTASDGAGTNGLYTGTLLRHIAEKGTTITSMFQKVRLDVINQSKNTQTPWEATSLTADFYFNP